MEDNLMIRDAGRNMHRSRGPSRSPSRSQASDSRPEETEIPKTRACANCARLKMKCRWPAAGAMRAQETSCVRCARMKLACHVPEPSQRRKRGKSTRVAQLEKKIDDIVSMLAASQATGSASLAPESPNTCIINNSHQKQQQPLAVPSDSSTFQLIPGFCFSREEVISYLDIYRREFMPNYPFVIIPDDIDPYSFYSESPCLFWMIMAAVTPQSTATQQSVGNWFRQYIAEHMVVRQEKRLVLLQAILLHLAWGDFHFYIKTEATNFVQLAMALVLDLKLDRSPESTNLHPKSLLGEAWVSLNKDAPRPRAHTPDEKRAVLGLYHVTSFISALFKRGNQLPWSSYLTQCCESLAEYRLESDLYLVALIKMQRVADRAYCMLPGFDVVQNGPGVYRSHFDMVINNVRRELEDLTASQPECVKRKNIFWAHYHVLLMRLFEPAISMYPPSSSESGVLPAEPFQRFETVWKCLLAAVDFFNALLSIAANELPGLPVSVTGLLAYAIVTSSRLLLLDASVDWQPAMARRKLDFADTMKRLSDRFEDADAWAKDAGRRRRLLDGGGTLFCRYSFKLRWIRQWYLSRVPQEQAWLAETQQPSGEPSQETKMLWQDFDFDDGFWPDLMSLYDPNMVAASETAHI